MSIGALLADTIWDFIDGVNTDIQGKLQIYKIVDYYCDNIDEANSLSEKLITVINSNSHYASSSRFEYIYMGNENKARFILFGLPDFIIKMLEIIK